MNIFFFTVTLLFCLLARDADAQAVPRIKCELGTTAWCIATFDGSISMQDADNSRVWSLQARTADGASPMKIIESKACSDDADEELRIIKSDVPAGVSSADKQVTEYALNSNGCKLRFEIPQGKSAATYRQVMLYGILVGEQKSTQLFKAKEGLSNSSTVGDNGAAR
ncbi:hypothetical protein [Thermomonas haemolytica]|uniref:hypothetical protein n=1 Tax=Thermomonas haemolytica TaxID=141949 RepID=UPI00104372DA|nr:hypothetical protein [Thermomonas haemolytica]